MARMREAFEELPKDAQLANALTAFTTCQGSGYYLSGIDQLESGKYPVLSTLSPWDKNRKFSDTPGGLWISVSTEEGRGISGKTYKGWITAHVKPGMSREHDEQYSVLHIGVAYKESGHFSVETGCIVIVRDRSPEVSHEMIIEGDVKPGQLPNDDFINAITEFSGFINEWKQTNLEI